MSRWMFILTDHDDAFFFLLSRITNYRLTNDLEWILKKASVTLFIFSFDLRGVIVLTHFLFFFRAIEPTRSMVFIKMFYKLPILLFSKEIPPRVEVNPSSLRGVR